MRRALVLLAALHVAGSTSIASTSSRPGHTQHALLARWLVHHSDWATLSTTSVHLGGAPFGNVASLSDGPPGGSTGRLLFYLTTMDAAAQDVEANSTATLTLCEAQLPGGCSGIDPEDPTCAKLSVTGSLEPVPAEDAPLAQQLLFSRHPAMRHWPAGHGFRVYELHPRTLRLLDYYGGAKDLTPEAYFNAGEAYFRAGGMMGESKIGGGGRSAGGSSTSSRRKLRNGE